MLLHGRPAGSFRLRVDRCQCYDQAMSELHVDRLTGPPLTSTVGGDAPPTDAPARGAAADSPTDGGGAAPTPANVTVARDARKDSHWLSFFVVAVAVVVLDQISKRFIDATLALGESWPSASWPVRIMHVKNTGAAFSMLQNQTLFLTVMSVVGLGAIVLYFVYRPSDHPLLRFALALQLGGAVGNLIDRARYGEVTDFIRVPHWPVFNVADSAITIGVTMVIVLLLFGGDGGRKAGTG
jgi:signal peptidase II